LQGGGDGQIIQPSYSFKVSISAIGTFVEAGILVGDGG